MSETSFRLPQFEKSLNLNGNLVQRDLMAKAPKSGNVTESTGIMPVRDTTFVRIYADVSLVVNQPQGVEISLFQRSPAFRNVVMSELGFPKSFETGTVLTDVARVRIGDEEAATLAYNILLSLAEGGIIDLESFDKNFSMVRTVAEKTNASNSE